MDDAKLQFVMANVVCPACAGRLERGARELRCPCGRRYPVSGGVPVFLDDPSSYRDERANPNTTNPYSPKSLRLIRENPHAAILDFGAGNPRAEELFPHVVRLDFVHYAATDVVCNTSNLPLADECFDFVVSESVFEHVADPWHYARELYRVLKPGGTIAVDTAFLQPVHGDPFHFFGMTLQGLQKTFEMFEIQDAGVESYQSCGTTMNILSRQFVELIEDEAQREAARQRLLGTDFAQFDRFIPKEKQPILAAGVYLVGRKANRFSGRGEAMRGLADRIRTRLWGSKRHGA